MFELPTTITVNGIEYPIRNKGDYRMVFDVFSALTDDELDISLRVMTALIIFIDGFESLEDVAQAFPTESALKEASMELNKFINCGEDDSIGLKTRSSVVDWEQDQQIIASAINVVAKKEIRAEPYIHWWTFLGYYMGIGEGLFSTIVTIRSKIKEGKKLEKYEQDFKRQNPQYFVTKRTEQEKSFDEELRRLWNEGE